MIRIVAGEYKGRKLKTPRGDTTRPSPARLREALFDALGECARGAVFYDLFAGSGAVGFEALSRGAARAVFVETGRAAVQCLRENIAALGCGDRAECVARALPGYLESPGFKLELPAIFFLDPPFRRNLAAATLETLAGILPDAAPPGSGWLDSFCAAQTEKEAALEEKYGVWRLRKRYPHGDNALWIYEVG